MASHLGFVGHRVLQIGLVTGGAIGASIVLLILGFKWWWCSLLGVAIVGVVYLGSGHGRPLDPRTWMRGLHGEACVSAELRQLQRRGYRLLEPVDLPYGDVDHVVIGPTGVFAIETKNWPGRIAREGNALKRERWDASSALRQAIRNAMAIKELTGVRWVEAIVVCVNSELREDPIPFERVTVTSVAGVTKLLTAGPRVLVPERIEELARRVADPAAQKRD